MGETNHTFVEQHRNIRFMKILRRYECYCTNECHMYWMNVRHVIPNQKKKKKKNK